MDVTIIIVNYNTAELTVNCINSIYEKTKDLAFEIIVVDNASKDNSVEIIKKEFSQVKLIESEVNLGFGRANNVGIKESKSKYVFLLNPDTLLMNNAVKILYDYMESIENYNVAACGADLYNADNKRVRAFGYFPSLKILLFKVLGIRSLFSKKFDRDKLQTPDWIIGADIMIRRSVLDKLDKFFDEDFFMYSEEVELQHRISKMGLTRVYYPEAQIIHLEGQSTKDPNFQKELNLFRSEFLFYEKRYGKRVLPIVKLLYFCYYLRYVFLRFFRKKELNKIQAILKA